MKKMECPDQLESTLEFKVDLITKWINYDY